MNVAVKAGVILAVLVTIVSAVILGSGSHENFLVYNLASIAIYIAINVGIVFWALRQTAKEQVYAGQLRGSLVLGLVGGLLIFSARGCCWRPCSRTRSTRYATPPWPSCRARGSTRNRSGNR